MIDREKVIGHLNDCMEASRQNNTWVFVRKDIVEDAIALLKEQEAVKPEWSNGRAFCGKCGQPFPRHRGIFRRYCSYCGKAVKWE